MYKKSLQLCSTPSDFSSINFEHCIVTLNNSIQLIGIYRPPPSRGNGLKTSEFLDELETFLDEKLVTPYKTAILGDFNVHVDSLDNRDSNKFAKIVSNAGFIQHVNGPTHKHGHTLDLVMSRDDEDLIHEVQVDPLLHSHHHVVKCTILCAKPPPLKISTTFREYGKMDHERFAELLHDRFSLSR